MCNDEAAFQVLNRKKLDRTVSIGDGSALSMFGRGTVHPTTVVNGKVHDVALQDVLFVPRLTRNLISVGRCRGKDARVTFDSGEDGNGVCTAEHVPTSHKVFCVVGNQENGLFEVVQSSFTKTESSHFGY